MSNTVSNPTQPPRRDSGSMRSSSSPASAVRQAAASVSVSKEPTGVTTNGANTAPNSVGASPSAPEQDEFPHTPLRFFCEGYNKIERAQKAFTESQQARRDAAVAQFAAKAQRMKARVAARTEVPSSGQPAPPPPPGLCEPPSFLVAVKHLLLVLAVIYIAWWCMGLA